MSASPLIPSPSSSGSTTPVQAVVATKDEQELLGEYRYKLASKLTNFNRFEGLLRDLGVCFPYRLRRGGVLTRFQNDHPDADIRQLIWCRDMAQKAYEDVKRRAYSDKLVELYNRVNPYETLEYLVQTDAERIDAAISNAAMDARIHWINYFRGDMLAKLALWYPTITIRKQSDEERWKRQREAAKRRENDEPHRLSQPIWRVASEQEPESDYPEAVLRAEKSRERRIEAERHLRQQRELRERQERELGGMPVAPRSVLALREEGRSRSWSSEDEARTRGRAGNARDRSASPMPGIPPR